MTPRDVFKLMAGWRNRIMLTIGRGIIRLVIPESTRQNLLQGVQATFLDGELIEMERVQEFGFASNPLPGAECAAVFIGGSREQGIIIATDDRRFRYTVDSGEAAIYSVDGTDIVATVRCLNTGEIIITTGNSQNVTINAAGDVDVNATGDVDVNATGNVEIEGATIKFGDTATLAVARHNDEVWTGLGGTGTKLGYVEAGTARTMRTKVFTE